MLNMIWEIAQTIIPIATELADNKKKQQLKAKIKELEFHIEKTKKQQRIIYICLLCLGIFIGYFISNIMS